MNNHPVRVGPIVGVHNGMISNDYALYNRMGEDVRKSRQGEVDTEAIFAAIYYGPQVDERGYRRLLCCETPADALAEIKGSAAVAWLDERDEEGVLHIARTRSSPLAWVQTVGGSLVFASTMETVLESCEVVGLVPGENQGWLAEGRYVELTHGAATNYLEFKPAPETYGYGYFSGRSSYTGGEGYKSAWDWEDEDDNSTYKGRTVVTVNRDYSITTESTEPVMVDSDWVTALDPELEITKEPSPAEREAAIDSWMDGVKGEDQSVLTLAMELKAFARVGDYVNTSLAGEDTYGQIVELPNSFPAGWYLIRALVPSPDCSDYEAVMVRRKSFEFDLVQPKETAPILALTTGTTKPDTPSEYVAVGVAEFQEVNAACLNESEGGDAS